MTRDEKLRELGRDLARACLAKEPKPATYTPPVSRLTQKELAAKAAEAKPTVSAKEMKLSRRQFMTPEEFRAKLQRLTIR
jgi:hypothetical protein